MAIAGEDVSLAEIKSALETLKYESGTMQVFVRPAGSMSPPSALHFLNEMSQHATYLTHFVDVIEKYEGKIDLISAQTLLEREQPLYQELDEPLRPKTA